MFLRYDIICAHCPECGYLYTAVWVYLLVERDVALFMYEHPREAGQPFGRLCVRTDISEYVAPVVVSP